MTNQEFYDALKDVMRRVETEEGYIEYLKDDVLELLEDEIYDEDEY